MTVALLTVFLSCGNKPAKKIDPQTIEVEVTTHYTNENGVICIVFGYGFNESQYYSQAIEKLGSIYGLNQDGGLIFPLVFPDDLKNGIKGVHKVLEGTTIKGIIFLGAPDETHLLLARYQDENGGEIPFPVISLFPQDNVLGQESTCSLILDYEHSSDVDTTTTETALHIDESADLIFANTVKYMANMNEPLKIGPELKNVVEKIVGAGTVFHRYVDRGSSMQALNHYIVESR